MSQCRHTPVSFSRDDLDQIREMMDKHLPVVCPKCGGTLKSGGVLLVSSAVRFNQITIKSIPISLSIGLRVYLRSRKKW